jgi:hypothetical protein
MCSDLVRLEDSAAAAPGRSASADGRGGEAAYRLDKRTYLDREQARWRIVAHDYGGGLCEIGWSFVASMVVGKAGRGDSEQRLVHEDRAVRRARSRLRQLVLSANADHLLTLTYRANVTDYRQASADLGRFIRRVKTYLPAWVYIAVPERQQRGAWHWHMAVIGRQNVDLLRGCWRGVIGDGNIDVQKPKNRTANRRLALVTYLGKYLAKGFEEGNRELNGHRFRASLGIKVPSQSIELPPEHRNDVSQYVLDKLRARAGSVGYSWVDPQGFAGWACSWR